ncbi:hypothetical protein LOK49_LG03G01840 [Camellia lanceoleosa]|uniref:Uncharacterized protein n=1 Tax=Camellia lanceoleosa TaxID=1840588 RepID=A0ACC0IGD3_9ERIC|nr:hypothetical protein LOK49_LG03G01840 [Camellia lanceoleosa]
MAGYGYMNRGYTDDGNKKTYGENGYFDPVSRPTIFEAEGRKRPIIFYSPNPGLESYITTSTKRIIEYGCLPMELVKNYGYNNDKWRRPSSPIRDHPQKGEEFISNVQVEPNRGATRPGFLGTTNCHNQSYSGNGTSYGEHDNYRRNDSFTEPAMINQDGGEGQMFGQKTKFNRHGYDTHQSQRDTYTTNPASRSSFYLHPCEGSVVQILTQGKLSAPRILRIHEVINHVVEKMVLDKPLDNMDTDGTFAPGLPVGQLQHPAVGVDGSFRLKPWQKLKPSIEILCNNQIQSRHKPSNSTGLYMEEIRGSCPQLPSGAGQLTSYHPPGFPESCANQTSRPTPSNPANHIADPVEINPERATTTQ